MKVKAINLTPYTQYVNADNDELNHDTTHVLGPKDQRVIEVVSEKHLQTLTTEFKSKVLFRKI